MASEMTKRRAKERMGIRWTAPLDKVSKDFVMEQIQLRNKSNNIFDTKAWGYIRDEFNKLTALNFNNNQLRKNLDVLRARYTQIKSASVQTDFAVEDSSGFDVWEGTEAFSRPEPVNIKDCPIYEQLCNIFADNGVDGRFSHTSHYKE
ncbi:L10-interacting MYB domain-containing protein [Bienertia sinuspersici]